MFSEVKGNRKNLFENGSLHSLSPSHQSSKDVKLKSINIMCGGGGEKKAFKHKNLAHVWLKEYTFGRILNSSKITTNSLFKLQVRL